MPIETSQPETTITCDNPACPFAAGKQDLPSWLAPDNVYGWVIVRAEHAGITMSDHVFCSLSCAAALVTAAGEITDADVTTGNIDDTVTLTGSGFKAASTVLVNGVPAEFEVKSDKKLTFTVPDGLGGPVVVETDGVAIISPFVFDTIQPEPEEEPSDDPDAA